MTTNHKKFLNFQELIFKLQEYWSSCGCVILMPIDKSVGAGTSHTATFLRSIGPEPWSSAYVQGCRRPTDGRYGSHPNRLQHYYQFQVCLKPSPDNIQDLYLNSLKYLGIDANNNDIRFIEDNWENPTLGAWGLGWEVWLNGMEISQFTYFQQVGGMDCKPVLGEITYGLERLAMYLQRVDSIYELVWTHDIHNQAIKYGDIFHQNELEQSKYNFEHNNTAWLFDQFEHFEQESNTVLESNLVLPAYELMLDAAHTFNLLDARAAISVTERANYIARIRNIAKNIAKKYYESRMVLDFPLLKK